jgi:hypothetical protein
LPGVWGRLKAHVEKWYEDGCGPRSNLTGAAAEAWSSAVDCDTESDAGTSYLARVRG